MTRYIRGCRVLVALLLALLAWGDLATSRIEVSQAAETAPMVARPSQVSSRGGPRSEPAPSLRLDVLTARAQFPPPTPTPEPSPTPVPTPEPSPTPQIQALGVFTVTGYSNSPRNGTDGRGITRSGERTRWGVVAVDPRVIPLRSQLKIEGMEETVFTALDTGGGVHGKWVDVWFPTDWDALQHGIKQRQVFLVRE